MQGEDRTAILATMIAIHSSIIKASVLSVAVD